MAIPRIGKISAALLLCCCSFPLVGKEQHLRFDTETDVYELTFDDGAISYEEMQRIAWLSPLIDPTLPHAPFMTGTQRVVPDKVEKIVMALPLETCLPGYAECQTPTLDSAF